MKVLVKGTGWGFPYMVPLKPTKTVAYCNLLFPRHHVSP